MTARATYRSATRYVVINRAGNMIAATLGEYAARSIGAYENLIILEITRAHRNAPLRRRLIWGPIGPPLPKIRPVAFAKFCGLPLPKNSGRQNHYRAARKWHGHFMRIAAGEPVT